MDPTCRNLKSCGNDVSDFERDRDLDFGDSEEICNLCCPDPATGKEPCPGCGSKKTNFLVSGVFKEIGKAFYTTGIATGISPLTAIGATMSGAALGVEAALTAVELGNLGDSGQLEEIKKNYEVARTELINTQTELNNLVSIYRLVIKLKSDIASRLGEAESIFIYENTPSVKCHNSLIGKGSLVQGCDLSGLDSFSRLSETDFTDTFDDVMKLPKICETKPIAIKLAVYTKCFEFTKDECEKESFCRWNKVN